MMVFWFFDGYNDLLYCLWLCYYGCVVYWYDGKGVYYFDLLCMEQVGYCGVFFVIWVFD